MEACSGGGKSGSPGVLFSDGIKELLFSLRKLFSCFIIADGDSDFIQLFKSQACFEKGVRLGQ